MSDIVENFKDLPGWLKLLIIGGGGLFLLVPLIVILAAVIGTFVLGMSGGEAGAPEAPMVQFEYDYDTSAEELTVTHAGGNSIDPDNLHIETGTDTQQWQSGSGEIHAGDTTTVSGVSSGDTVTIYWSDGDETIPIGSYTVE